MDVAVVSLDGGGGRLLEGAGWAKACSWRVQGM